MKIMIIEVWGMGGLAHYTYNLCQSIADFSEVVLLTETKYELGGFKRNFLLFKIFGTSRSYFKNMYGLVKMLFREKPDIIHFQNFFSARKDWLLFMILKFFGLPIMLTVHNVFPHEDLERNARGVKFCLKTIYSCCQALIVHSLWTKKELLSNFDIDEDKVYSIPHGHYLFLARNRENLSKDIAREKLGLPIESKVVLCFGTIREYKGIQYLIPAFSKVIKKIPTARLIIVGSPKVSMVEQTVEQSRELIKGHNLEKFTLFLPQYVPINDIPLYFSSADIAVFPYLHTYGSGSLQSAFAFSKPVVVTRVGIFPEFVEEGKNGYFVPPEDADSLAKAIVKMLSLDAKELEKMGKHSRYLAETKYNWTDIAKSTVEIYKGIIG